MKKRPLLDLVLLVLLLTELASFFVSSRVHEVLGVAFVVLVLVHLWWNAGFFRAFGRGRYPWRRLLGTAVVLAFVIDMVVLTVSGVATSHFLFPSIHLPRGVNWRSLHLGAAAVSAFLLFLHGALLGGRYVKGWKLRTAAGLVLVLAIGGVFGLPYLDRWQREVHVNRPMAVAGEKAALSGRTVVVYFSRVGNTDFPDDVDAVSGASLIWDRSRLPKGPGWKQARTAADLVGNAELLADMAADATDAERIFLQTVQKYPASYPETTEVAKEEFASAAFPALQPLTAAEEAALQSADNVILVTPLWWGTLPRTVEGFVRSHDFAGKRIFPIITHGGTGAGESASVLRDAAPDADLAPVLDVYSSDVPGARGQIAAYLKANGGAK